MQHEVSAQFVRDRKIRIKDSAEEAAVRAAKLIAEFTQESQGKNRLAGFLGCSLRLAHVRIPVHSREMTVFLLADGVERCAKALPLRGVGRRRVNNLFVDRARVNSKHRVHAGGAQTTQFGYGGARGFLIGGNGLPREKFVVLSFKSGRG